MRLTAGLFILPLVFQTTALTAEAQLASKPEIRALCDAAVEAKNTDMLRTLRDAISLAYPNNPKVLAYCADSRLSVVQSETDMEEIEPTEAVDTSRPVFSLSPWSGDLALNAALHRGNTVASTFGFRLDAERKTGSVVNNFGATGAHNRNNGVDEVDRWNAYFQRDHHLKGSAFAYWRVAYEQDEFADFGQRAFLGFGAGRRFIETGPFNLQAEIGPGAFIREVSGDESRDLIVDAALFSALRANYQLNSHVRLKHDMELNWSEPSGNFVSVSSIKTAITDQLSLGLSFETRYQTSPDDDRQPTDTALMADIHFGY